MHNNNKNFQVFLSNPFSIEYCNHFLCGETVWIECVRSEWKCSKVKKDLWFFMFFPGLGTSTLKEKDINFVSDALHEQFATEEIFLLRPQKEEQSLSFISPYWSFGCLLYCPQTQQMKVVLRLNQFVKWNLLALWVMFEDSLGFVSILAILGGFKVERELLRSLTGRRALSKLKKNFLN